ncbi:PDZ domain-containing protein [bacterium]|nr:PDZ domain-containing protein [bacterium]
MRYLLSLLLLFSFGFTQKTIVVKKQVEDEKKIEVKTEVKDNKFHCTITEDGKTEEYEADLNDDDAMAKIHEKLAGHNCEVLVMPKKKCDKDEMVWKTKDGCDEKKIKIIKKYKDEPLLADEKTGFLGVQIQDLSEQLSGYFKVKDGNGVLVSEVVKDSPAEKAGLKAGDIITRVNDKDIENAGDLTMTIRGYEPETKVAVAIIRDGKKKQLDATLGESEQADFYKFDDLGEMGVKHKMMLKMHPESLDEFEFHGFPFEQEKFQQQMEELQKELQEMKEDLKKLKEEK